MVATWRGVILEISLLRFKDRLPQRHCTTGLFAFDLSGGMAWVSRMITCFSLYSKQRNIASPLPSHFDQKLLRDDTEAPTSSIACNSFTYPTSLLTWGLTSVSLKSPSPRSL